MINIHSLMASVDAQGSIKTLADHLEFAEKFLDYTGLSKKDGLKINQANLQSLTVAINNHDYYFIQFPQSVNFSLTRPINKDLFLDINEFSHNKSEFLKIIKSVREIKDDSAKRELLNCFVYTCQMSIACTLDAFGNPNKARKKNGAYFENLIRYLVKECGIENSHAVEKINIGDSEDTFSWFFPD